MKLPIFLAILSIAIATSPWANRSLAHSHNQNTAHTRSQMQAGMTDITTSPAVGFFNAHPWHFKISKEGNSYIYSGKNIETNRGIDLAGGKMLRSQGKQIYKWSNGTIYQVTWRATDPMYARLQVFDRQGKEVLNKLMWTPTGN
jgi:RecG-like helicase